MCIRDRRQTIGDTLGIGGIMRALRTIPVMADFARDMEEVCPDALFPVSYTHLDVYKRQLLYSIRSRCQAV